MKEGLGVLGEERTREEQDGLARFDSGRTGTGVKGLVRIEDVERERVKGRRRDEYVVPCGLLAVSRERSVGCVC